MSNPTMAQYEREMEGAWDLNRQLKRRNAELEKVELETVTKTRKMFVANARKFGYSNSVGYTIQELQKWEQKLKEQIK